jgi:hypothetical protein
MCAIEFGTVKDVNEFRGLEIETELAGAKKTPFFGTVIADMILVIFITKIRRNGF